MSSPLFQFQRKLTDQECIQYFNMLNSGNLLESDPKWNLIMENLDEITSVYAAVGKKENTISVQKPEVISTKPTDNVDMSKKSVVKPKKVLDPETKAKLKEDKARIKEVKAKLREDMFRAKEAAAREKAAKRMEFLAKSKEAHKLLKEQKKLKKQEEEKNRMEMIYDDGDREIRPVGQYPINIIDSYKKVKMEYVGLSQKDMMVKGPIVILDEKFKRYEENIPNFNTDLLNYQKTLVQAMLDYETHKTIELYDGSLNFNTGILSNSVGTGKTIIFLALIAIKQNIEERYQLTPYTLDAGSRTVGTNNIISGYYKTVPIRKLKSNLLFVSTSILNQIEGEIKKLTKFDYFVIRKINDLDKFVQMVFTGDSDQYPIVLIKNGIITRKPHYPEGMSVAKYDYLYIYSAIAAIQGVSWARVIVDDYQDSKISSMFKKITAGFSWYISATVKHMLGYVDIFSLSSNGARLSFVANSVKKDNPGEYLNLTNENSFCFQNGLIMNRILNLRCSENYIKTSKQMFKCRYFIITFINNNINFINALGVIPLKGRNVEIQNAINADNFEEAAKLAGIEAKSVADLFKKVLKNNYERYMLSSAVIDFIKYQKSIENDRLPYDIDEVDEEDRTYTKKDLLNFKDIKYHYPNIDDFLEKYHNEYSEIKEEVSKGLNRVKESMKDNECCICNNEFDENINIIITDCCNSLFCDECGIKAQKLDKNNKNATGVCSNCRSEVKISNLIYVKNKNISMENILNDEIEEFNEPQEFKKEQIEKVEKEENKNIDQNKIIDTVSNLDDSRDKYIATLKIILGIHINRTKLSHMKINNIADGYSEEEINYMKNNRKLHPDDYIKVEAKELPKKVLFFSNYDKSLKYVIDIFNKYSIPFWKLDGTYQKISETVDMFRNCPHDCALIVNSTKHCAGLNLQFATDLVFMQYNSDDSTETQVIGRGQRIGRISDLRIWYLIYENELATMKNVRSIIDLE